MIPHRRILAASLAVVVIAAFSAGAQDATFDLKTDVPVAAKMLAQGAYHKVFSGEDLTEYGNWYGPGYWGGGRSATEPGSKQPVDALDAIAQRHDFAYQIAEEQGKIHGPAEEKRLKGLADAIAVRDSKRLPEDPRDWDPPASNPESADRYRDRIGFGFAYTSVGYTVAAAGQRTLQQVRNALNADPTRVTQSSITEADLDRMARQRAIDWYGGNTVRPMYRIDLSAASDLVVEHETVQIDVKLVPVVHDRPVPGLGDMKIVVPLTVSGPGRLSATRITPDASVTLTATNRLYVFSAVGSTIKVSAEYDAGTFDVLPGSATVTVAKRTAMDLSITPDSIQEWTDSEGNPILVDVTLRAVLTEVNGGAGVAGLPLTFTLPDGTTFEKTTGAGGVAEFTRTVGIDDLQGEAFKEFRYRVATAGTKGESGTVYTASSDSVILLLKGDEAIFVTGVVADRQRNGRPIPGAAVRIEGPQGIRSGTTDSNGRFRVRLAETFGEALSLQGTVTAEGYESGQFSVRTAGQPYTIQLQPLQATVTGRVIDAETKGPIDGATVAVSEPFVTLLNTQSGEFAITGLFVGDRLTMTADAVNHKAYTKSGMVTMASAHVTFSLPEGKGDLSGDLDATEADPISEEDLPIIHSLMAWASPADPGSFQDVTVFAQVFPPQAGVQVEISMVGTDGYSSSISGMTDAMGRVSLRIPGAASGVVDDVIARIVGENVRQQIKYSF